MVPFAIVLGLLILTAFVLWERRVEQRGGTPIVSLRIFRNRGFVAGASVVGVIMLSQNGIVFSLPVFLQSVRQLDAFHTGLTLLPMPLMLFLVAPTAAVLSKKIPHKRLAQAGLVVNFFALLAMRWALGVSTPLWMLVPGLALYGVGMGLVQSQINNLTLSAVDVREAGEASGITNTFRQVGSALGSAIIGAILLTAIVGDLQGAVRSSPRIPPDAKPGVDRLLREQSSSLAFGSGGVFDRLPPATRDEMTAARRVATTDGNRKALLYGAGFVLIGLLVSTQLPLWAGRSGGARTGNSSKLTDIHGAAIQEARQAARPVSPRGAAPAEAPRGALAGRGGAALVLSIALVLVVLAYANAIHGQFVYDDQRQILRNPLIQQPALLGKALTSDVWAFSGAEGKAWSNYWRPAFVAWLSLHYALFGTDPTGWHVTNIALHFLATALGFFVLRALGARPAVCAVATWLFAVSPVHVESVTWISGSPDPMAASLLFAAFLGHLAARARRADGLSARRLSPASAPRCSPKRSRSSSPPSSWSRSGSSRSGGRARSGRRCSPPFPMSESRSSISPSASASWGWSTSCRPARPGSPASCGARPRCCCSICGTRSSPSASGRPIRSSR